MVHLKWAKNSLSSVFRTMGSKQYYIWALQSCTTAHHVLIYIPTVLYALLRYQYQVIQLRSESNFDTQSIFKTLDQKRIQTFVVVYVATNPTTKTYNNLVMHAKLVLKISICVHTYRYITHIQHLQHTPGINISNVILACV